MLESILSWIMLFYAMGAETNAVNWFIASGIFAIAAYLSDMRDKGERK